MTGSAVGVPYEQRDRGRPGEQGVPGLPPRPAGTAPDTAGDLNGQLAGGRYSSLVHGAPRSRMRERRSGLAYRDKLGAALPSFYYEIRVTGVLPPEALLDFERLSSSVEPVETVVHGPLRDQADLHGLLARLQTFGAQVVEVRRLHDPAPPDPVPPEDPDQPAD